MDDKLRAELLAGYPVVVTVPIHWGDHDAFGHVNNTVPLRWFETARIAFLEKCGLGHLMNGQGPIPVVASITCNYRRQLFYPDRVDVSARLEKIGRTSLVLSHAVVSHHLQTIAVDGQSVVVMIDATSHRPCRIPEDFREKFLAMQGAMAENLTKK